MTDLHPELREGLIQRHVHLRSGGRFAGPRSTFYAQVGHAKGHAAEREGGQRIRTELQPDGAIVSTCTCGWRLHEPRSWAQLQLILPEDLEAEVERRLETTRAERQAKTRRKR